jgi:hypothetical protein
VTSISYAEVSGISRDGKQVAYAWYDEKGLPRKSLRLNDYGSVAHGPARRISALGR